MGCWPGNGAISCAAFFIPRSLLFHTGCWNRLNSILIMLWWDSSNFCMLGAKLLIAELKIFLSALCTAHFARRVGRRCWFLLVQICKEALRWFNCKICGMLSFHIHHATGECLCTCTHSCTGTLMLRAPTHTTSAHTYERTHAHTHALISHKCTKTAIRMLALNVRFFFFFWCLSVLLLFLSRLVALPSFLVVHLLLYPTHILQLARGNEIVFICSCLLFFLVCFVFFVCGLFYLWYNIRGI